MDKPYEAVTLTVMVNSRDRNTDLLYPQPFPVAHLERDGQPYCQTGGFNLRNWNAMTVAILPANVCRRCWNRKAVEDRDPRCRPRARTEATTT